MNILVIAEHNNTNLLPATLHTVNAAKQIGKADLLVIGYNCQDVVDEGRKIEGINQVILSNDAIYETPLAENTALLIQSVAKDYTHILFASTANGKNTAPRLAALLDVMIIPDIIEIIDHETFKRPIYAGNAIATCKSSDACKIITVRTTAFEKATLTGDQAKTISVDPAKKTDLTK